MKDLLNRIKGMIKSGQAQEYDDSGDIQTSESNWLGRSMQTVESLVPYGLFGTPLAKCRQILFSLRANESNQSGFNVDSANRIIKNTKPGDMGIGSPKAGSYMYFKEDGVIETKTDEMTVVLSPDGKISITGASEEMVSVIDEWMTTMIGAMVVTGIGIMPFDPATIAKMTAVQVKFQTFQE